MHGHLLTTKHILYTPPHSSGGLYWSPSVIYLNLHIYTKDTETPDELQVNSTWTPYGLQT